MYFPNCSSENSETRKFCSECGSLIVRYCTQCSFANASTDKFCGGCGKNLSSPGIVSPSEAEHPDSSGKAFSSYEIKDLIDDTSQSKAKLEKKKKKIEAENVSQDLIDNIFGPDEREIKKEDS